MNSKDYWAKREQEALKHYITDEKQYEKELHRIYQNMLDNCQKEIDSFYGKYARKEGITIAEAKKRVAQHDVKAFERKAEQYVRTKDFSEKANEELRLYNATMKINRLEMLKANIGLELLSGHDEIDKFMAGILQGRTEDELKRQAGILGKTIQNNAKAAHAIVNGSFHSGTFSDRIWQYQDLMREDLGRLLQQGLIRGKNPRAIAKDLRQYWYGRDPKTGGGATYCMERLMRTELARVQIEAQKQSFEKNGFSQYIFIVNHNGGNCCPDCQRVADKGPYLVSKMMPGLNAPPMHPHCRCSTAAYEDDAAYEAWLDGLANGSNETFQQAKKAAKKTTAKKAPAKAQKQAPAKPKEGQLDINNFPASFLKGAERKNTQKFVDYVNSLKGANADTIRLYNSMGKLENIESKGYKFSISHGKNHAVGRREYIDGRLAEVKLTIPKLSGDNLTGQINTMLHENMHLIDMYCRTSPVKGGDWFSSSRKSLRDVFSRTSPDMSDEVSDLFKQFKTEYHDTRKRVSDEYSRKRAELKESYFPNGASIWSDIPKYRQYEKEAKKLDTWYENEMDYQCRNIMGGGVNALQDIYDAASGGKFRDNGTVLYGHGSKYYRSTENRVNETLANYGVLSVAHPELLEMLRRDKPELVAELEATVKDMLKKAGE